MVGFGQVLHFVVIEDFNQVVVDVVVVGAVGVVELLDVVEDGLNVGDVAGGADPELAPWVFEVFCFYVTHLVYGVVPLFAPLQLLVQEVQHREVEGPDVVTAREVDIVVGVQGGEGDSAAEINFAAFGQRLLRHLVKVALGEAEVHDVNAAGLAAQDEVGGFDVAVDEAPLVHLANSGEHLDQNVNGNFK